MTREEFILQRQDDWDRFEALLTFAEGKRVPQWSGEDTSEFSSLFRAICHDLALVRSRDFGLALNRYLNSLVVRGHTAFYKSPPGSLRKVLRLVLEEFPWLLRQNIRYFWVALALFVLPGLAAGILLANQPELATRLFPQQQLEMYADMHAGGRPGFEPGQPREGDEEGSRMQVSTEPMPVAMTGFYVQHNVGIAFKCFAGGALLGIGSICHLVFNSIAIGGITGYMVAVGNSKPFFTFVVSHGSFELTAIVIAGAAGLIIGRSIVHPGEMTRTESMKVRGLVALKLALGAGVMLCVAAVIEGFWSPSPAPSIMKFIIGGVLWTSVIVFLALAGRDFQPDADQAGSGSV